MLTTADVKEKQLIQNALIVTGGVEYYCTSLCVFDTNDITGVFNCDTVNKILTSNGHCSIPLAKDNNQEFYLGRLYFVY